MGFHLSHHATISFVGIVMILIHVKAYFPEFPINDFSSFERTDPSVTQKTLNIDPHTSNSELTAPKFPKKSDHLLRENPASYQLSRLLSPDILSNADPFQYLIRETTKLSRWTCETLGTELLTRLKQEKFSKLYIPYAQALRAILRAQFVLRYVQECIREFRSDRNLATIPGQISSPPALSETGLFSRDILTDPNPPIRLLNKLMEIPKNDITSIIIQLENYARMSIEWRDAPFKWWTYISYAKELVRFLQKDILDDLKSTMDEIRRVSTIKGQRPDEIGSNNESNLPYPILK